MFFSLATLCQKENLSLQMDLQRLIVTTPTVPVSNFYIAVMGWAVVDMFTVQSLAFHQ